MKPIFSVFSVELSRQDFGYNFKSKPLGDSQENIVLCEGTMVKLFPHIKKSLRITINVFGDKVAGSKRFILDCGLCVHWRTRKNDGKNYILMGDTIIQEALNLDDVDRTFWVTVDIE